MKDEIPITEADLHAYIDDQLSPERRQMVITWLKKNPKEAKRIQQYQAISEKLHQNFDPVLDQSIPDSLKQIGLGLKPAYAAKRLFKTAIAASLILTGALAGWFSHSFYQNSSQSFFIVNLIKPAAFAHTVYASDYQHPVEFNSENQARLISWLSDRLRTKIKAPNLASLGYRLIGGRLIPSTNRMAAQFMYEYRNGERVTLYIRRVSSLQFHQSQTRLSSTSNKGVRIIYWRKGEMGYAISGDLENKVLSNIANISRKQTSI